VLLCVAKTAEAKRVKDADDDGFGCCHFSAGKRGEDEEKQFSS
jgi:hypothetical protein